MLGRSVAWRRLRREEIGAMHVDAAHVLAPDRQPVPIEELEDLNSDFPAVVELIAEIDR